MKAADSHAAAGDPVEWSRSDGLVGYTQAVAAMEARVGAIASGQAREAVWLIEHPPVYTAGTSARIEDLVTPDRFPVFKTGRGGQYTYHGPGQRVVYVMLDVRKRFGDVRAFVRELEGWTIDAIGHFGITSHTTPGRVGVWVPRPSSGAACEDKIAAIGVRLRRWVSFHGIAINVSPDLEHFSGIVPCGISDQGVTSLSRLSESVPGLGTYRALPEGARARALMDELDRALLAAFEARIGVLHAGEPLPISV